MLVCVCVGVGAVIVMPEGVTDAEKANQNGRNTKKV